MKIGRPGKSGYYGEVVNGTIRARGTSGGYDANFYIAVINETGEVVHCGLQNAHKVNCFEDSGPGFEGLRDRRVWTEGDQIVLIVRENKDVGRFRPAIVWGSKEDWERAKRLNSLTQMATA